jgi:precorrin-2 dehydrogenase/sirohydrochlorin ferrochelatase
MIYLPIFLNISKKNILIVGSGKAALQKIRILENFTGNLTVIAPKIPKEIKSRSITFIESEFSKEMLNGFSLVYACTDDRKLNKQIKDCAKKLNILVNIVDDPELSDFISPAIFKQNNMTVAVSSNGQNVTKAIRWRNRLKEFFENDKTS